GQAEVVHAEAAVYVDVAVSPDDPPADWPIAIDLLERARQVDPVERQDHVGFAYGGGCGLREIGAGRPNVQRMLGREARAGLEVGHHPGAELVGERHPRAPALEGALAAADQPEGPPGAGQDPARARDQLGRGARGLWSAEARRIGERRQRAELRLS